MFTGIVETLAKIENIEQSGTNYTFTFSSDITSALKVDQSVSHSGVCLTVVQIQDQNYQVTAIDETLQKTNLGTLSVGNHVNLERCMPANGRFDGHIVQGHVDTTGICTNIQDQDGSWLFDFEYPENEQHITVEKGSICINGVSLTVFNSEKNTFRVAIIPYTYEHTTFKELVIGSTVNLEFDIVGKYIRKMLQYQNKID